MDRRSTAFDDQICGIGSTGFDDPTCDRWVDGFSSQSTKVFGFDDLDLELEESTMRIFDGRENLLNLYRDG